MSIIIIIIIIIIYYYYYLLKLAIALQKEGNILSNRTEIISKCRHSIKYNFANYDTKDSHQVNKKV